MSFELCPATLRSVSPNAADVERIHCLGLAGGAVVEPQVLFSRFALLTGFSLPPLWGRDLDTTQENQTQDHLYFSLPPLWGRDLETTQENQTQSLLFMPPSTRLRPDWQSGSRTEQRTRPGLPGSWSVEPNTRDPLLRSSAGPEWALPSLYFFGIIVLMGVF